MSEPSQCAEGRCFCGSVRFRVTPPTDFAAHCHCESCRLSHGAAFVTWSSVPKDQFTIEAGEERVRWYRSSETIEWGFCDRCGSSMLYRAVAPGHPENPKTDRMYFCVASVDKIDREPSVHVSFEERVPWLDVGDALPKHRGKTNQRIE